MEEEETGGIDEQEEDPFDTQEAYEDARDEALTGFGGDEQ